MDFGPQPAQKYNTMWGQSRKYNMGPKQTVHTEANAENTSGPHDGVAAASVYQSINVILEWEITSLATRGIRSSFAVEPKLNQIN